MNFEDRKNHIVEMIVDSSAYSDRLTDEEKALFKEDLSDMIGNNFKKEIKRQAINIIKDIVIREKELSTKQTFCREHNFNLDALKFDFAKEELRQTISKLQSHFETGYVSS